MNEFSFKTNSNNPIPVESNINDLNKVTKGIGSALESMKRESSVIRMSEIEVGQSFDGIVYVTNTRSHPNRWDTSKFDITFNCIDGDGKMFIAKMWRSDMNIEHIDTPMLIKEGVSVLGNNNKIYYNLNKVERYINPIPISIFLKEIRNLNQVKSDLSTIINNIKDPSCKQIINMLDSTGYRDILFKTTHKALIGTQIGKTAEILVTVFNTIREFSAFGDLNQDLIFTALYANLFKYKISQKNFVPEDNYTQLYPVHPLVQKAVDSVPFEEKTRVKLLSMIMGDKKTAEGKLLYNILDTVEDHIRTIENLSTTKDGESSYGIYKI